MSQLFVIMSESNQESKNQVEEQDSNNLSRSLEATDRDTPEVSDTDSPGVTDRDPDAKKKSKDPVDTGSRSDSQEKS